MAIVLSDILLSSRSLDNFSDNVAVRTLFAKRNGKLYVNYILNSFPTINTFSFFFLFFCFVLLLLFFYLSHFFFFFLLAHQNYVTDPFVIHIYHIFKDFSFLFLAGKSFLQLLCQKPQCLQEIRHSWFHSEVTDCCKTTLAGLKDLVFFLENIPQCFVVPIW